MRPIDQLIELLSQARGELASALADLTEDDLREVIRQARVIEMLAIHQLWPTAKQRGDR